MEESLELLLAKAKLLQEAVPVVKSMHPHMTGPCDELFTVLNKTENLIAKRRSQLEKKNKLINQMEELCTRCDEISSRVEQINENYPLDEDTTQSFTDEAQYPNELEVSPCPSNWALGVLDTPRETLGQTPGRTPGQTTRYPMGPCYGSVMPAIYPVQPNEMQTVPVYMKGRLDVVKVNAFVTKVNHVLEQKYSILELKRRDVKRKDLMQYINWKEQEDSYGLTGKIFFMADDIIQFSGSKLDKLDEKIVQILRHLKRLRQIQVAGRKIIYVLCQ